LRGGEIVLAENALNDRVFTIINGANIQKKGQVTVLVEDIRPYGLKLSPQIIETCKYLGELRYRLKRAKIACEWIPRNTVKKWVFDAFPEVCLPRIQAKIVKKGAKNRNGGDRQPSFIWVDDRIVIAAMKVAWNIETPKPGKTNRYGIKAHAWQALGMGAYSLATNKKS